MGAWDDPLGYMRDLEAQVAVMRATIAEVVRDGERHGGRASIKPLLALLEE